MSVTVFWERIPVVIRAVLTGLLVAALGTTPWAVLVNLNFKYASALPWATLVTAGYLWLYWRYLQGAWWPRSTADVRKKNCRANGLSDETWGAALVAGIAGLVFIVLFESVWSRMVRFPKQSVQYLSNVPLLTLFFSAVMSAIVAGVAEETGFRGYMQKPIEKKYGPVPAILVVGLLFGFAHLSHAEVSVALMPYYLTVAAVYGMLAYLTNSIFPSMVLHAGGNMLSAMGLLLTRNTEQQVPAKPALLVWETGFDSSFLIACGATLVVGAITVLAFRWLAKIAKNNQHQFS